MPRFFSVHTGRWALREESRNDPTAFPVRNYCRPRATFVKGTISDSAPSFFARRTLNSRRSRASITTLNARRHCSRPYLRLSLRTPRRKSRIDRQNTRTMIARSSHLNRGLRPLPGSKLKNTIIWKIPKPPSIVLYLRNIA